MAGGFFSGGESPAQPPQRIQDTESTTELSPGGFFDGGASAEVARSIATNEADAERWAQYSKGWAVGSSTGSLGAFSDTNNSLYYSEQSGASASSAATSAENASTSASGAAASRAAADASATAAATSATASANSATASAASAAAADSDAIAAAASAASAAANAATTQFDSESAARDAGRAEASETAAAASAAAADLSAQAAARDSDGTAVIYADAQALETRLDALAIRVDSDAAVAIANSTLATSEANRARSWAVGPNPENAVPSATNNAQYWAMVARNASELETVQFDFQVTNTNNNATGLPDGVRYGDHIINIDSEEYYIEDPIISYNGVTLSDGEHYTWTQARVTFSDTIHITDGDCITVTSGGARDSLAEASDFIAGSGITIEDSDSKVKISSTATGGGGSGGGNYAMAETIEINYTGATWSNGIGISNADIHNVGGWIDWTGFSTQAASGWTAKDSEVDGGGFGVDSLHITNGTGSAQTIHRIDLVYEVSSLSSSSDFSIRIYNGSTSVISNFSIQGSLRTEGVRHVIIQDGFAGGDWPNSGVTVANGASLTFGISNANTDLRVLNLGFSTVDNTPFDFAGTGGTRSVNATGFTALGSTPIPFTHNLPWFGVSTSGTDTDDYTWIAK